MLSVAFKCAFFVARLATLSEKAEPDKGYDEPSEQTHDWFEEKSNIGWFSGARSSGFLLVVTGCSLVVGGDVC